MTRCRGYTGGVLVVCLICQGIHDLMLWLRGCRGETCARACFLPHTSACAAFLTPLLLIPSSPSSLCLVAGLRVEEDDGPEDEDDESNPYANPYHDPEDPDGHPEEEEFEGEEEAGEEAEVRAVGAK